MITRFESIFIFLIGLGLLVIGARFLLFPEQAESDFGISFHENDDYSFHYIKGIRDIFSGLILLIFLLIKQRLSLIIGLFVGSTIPMVDTIIVLNKNGYDLVPAIPHICAFFICVLLASFMSLKNFKKV